MLIHWKSKISKYNIERTVYLVPASLIFYLCREIIGDPCTYRTGFTTSLEVFEINLAF